MYEWSGVGCVAGSDTAVGTGEVHFTYFPALPQMYIVNTCTCTCIYSIYKVVFSLKNNCLGRVVLCCFVFLLCCVALSFFLSKHLMDN